jgi:hypothetical protein
MPEFAKWVNGHHYDGGRLSQEQQALRHFYAALLALCQDPSVRGDGYWGLKYFNRGSAFPDCADDLYTFARFQGGSGRLLVVAANFRPGADLTVRVRIPAPLVALAGLPAEVTVRLVLEGSGSKDEVVSRQTRDSLSSTGFRVTLPNQTSQVYAIA